MPVASARLRNPSAFSWQFLTPVYLGSALNPINTSVLATALVPIALALNVPVGQTVVLITALYLTSAIAQPTAGKIAQEFGPRRVFVAGILIVLAGGLVGGLGQNFTALIVSRILLGIGTSAAYPTAMVLIRRRAESAGLAAPPGGVLGGLQIAAMVTAALGLPIGGVLVDAWGWRTTFLINIPMALIALVMTLQWIPRDPPIEGSMSAREVASRIDAPGLLGFAAAVTALLSFLFSLPHPLWLALVLAIAFTAALVAWELRASSPFLDVRLLATNRALSRTYLRMALTTFCIYTVFYGLTQWLQAGRGVSSRDAGLLLLPMTALSAIIMGPISHRNLVRGPLITGAAASLLGSIGLLFFSTSTPFAWIVVITLIFGTTLATAASGNQIALYTQVPGNGLGTASGLMRTFTYVGSIGSTAMIGIVFRTGVTDGGLHVLAAVMVAVSAVALLVTLSDRHLRTPSRKRDDAGA